ncbi:MAG: tetratricopeptide repeat protein [Rhizobacter sp.]
MSLINQVLRDLDKRQAKTAATPAAVKASPLAASSNGVRRLGRWGAGVAVTAVAIIGGGVAQGSIQWPARSAAAPLPIAAIQPVAVAPTAVIVSPVATHAPDPTTPAASSTLTLDARLPATPVLQALAAPTSRPAITATPRAQPKARAPALADLSASAPALPKPEARIDKRMASRTPQERAEANYQRGVTAHQAGQINDSADAFMAALREDPRYAPARQAQAGLLIGQSRFDEALTLLQEGVALTPQQPMLALMLARLQAERQDLSTAADTLKAAAAHATNNAEYLGFYAAILQRANRHAEAAEQFSTALRLSPANSVWWMGLGISLAAGGQPDAAREAFMRAKTTGALPPEAGQYVELRLRQLL